MNSTTTFILIMATVICSEVLRDGFLQYGIVSRRICYVVVLFYTEGYRGLRKPIRYFSGFV
jgi:hypothetical protein